jgi:hypothetical protein
MQKLIRKIISGHGLYLGILLLLGGYVLYTEYSNQDDRLKEVLAQDLQGAVKVIRANYEQLNAGVIKTNEDYPSQQNELYCNRFMHLAQQADSLSAWIANGLSGKQKPYFPALKEAYINHQELTKIYCDGDEEVLRWVSAFNPEIAPMHRFDGPLFLVHAQVASLMNLVLSGNYVSRKISGPYCGFDKFFPYLFYHKLNFQDNGSLEGVVLLSNRSLRRSKLFPFTKQQHLFLNNREFPIKGGVASFQYQFDTPGIHPLQVRWQYDHPHTDSVTMFEKTYYVKVVGH